MWDDGHEWLITKNSEADDKKVHFAEYPVLFLQKLTKQRKILC